MNRALLRIRRNTLQAPCNTWTAVRCVYSLLLASLLLCPALAAGGEADGGNDTGATKRAGLRLPAFTGQLLSGEVASSEMLRGRRAILFFFASSDDHADAFAGMLAGLAPAATRSNIAIVGVARDAHPSEAERLLRKHGLEIPVFADGRGAISGRIGVLGGSAALIVVDAEGYGLGGFFGIQEEATLAAYEAMLRQTLHLEKSANSVDAILGVRPPAPDFEITDLEGGTLGLADLDGRVVVLVMFLPDCPHCHRALDFLDQLSEELATADLAIVPVSLSNKKYVIQDMAERLDVELPMYVDKESTMRVAYSHPGSVPDITILDRQQRVAYRHGGMGPRIEALMTMEIRQELGVETPIRLDDSGYSGDASCLICHRVEHQTWALTNHAYAFDSLVSRGEERNAECLPCHTVGFGEPGGYGVDSDLAFLEGVGCENCHGRGGPHQSLAFAQKVDYRDVCAPCHTQEHSLRFVYDERLPMVSHASNAHLAGLSVEERHSLVERRDRRSRTLFEAAAFVGPQGCQECHQIEYESWAHSPHAHALATLEKEGRHGDAECQACHTTGFGQPGGFPEGGEPMRDVGCESCHGPGGDHVATDPVQPGTILSLKNVCDSCVILQICGSCHDEANDPGFEFSLATKLDAVRHRARDQAEAAVR